MPNWSFTYSEIYFNEKDLPKVKKLVSDIKEWTSKNYIDNGFGTEWLGNIVGFSGLDTCTATTDFSIRCRGTLKDISNSDNCLYIDTETAWSPMFEMWILLLKKYEINYEHFYFDSYDDMGNYHITNNPEYLGRYIIDIWDDKIHEDLNIWEQMYGATEENVLKVLQYVLKTDETNVDKLLEQFHESEVENVYITKWEEDKVENYCNR